MGKINNAMQKIVCFPIRLYQLFVNPVLPPCCRFYPSCSQYALSAIQHYGILKGVWLAFCRILRCHPFSQGGYDPVSNDKEKN